jgi:hypothetical protein
MGVTAIFALMRAASRSTVNTTANDAINRYATIEAPTRVRGKEFERMAVWVAGSTLNGGQIKRQDIVKWFGIPNATFRNLGVEELDYLYDKNAHDDGAVIVTVNSSGVVENIGFTAASMIPPLPGRGAVAPATTQVGVTSQ